MSNEKYFSSGWGGRWTPITREYFETILIDFFGRPDGWCSTRLLMEIPGKIGIHCKPKKHNNHHGLSRDYNGNFRPVHWVDFKTATT